MKEAYVFDRDKLKKRTFKIQSLNIPYKEIHEKEATVELKLRAWTDSANLFDGEQTIILDIPIGNNTRIRFDRTRDRFRFIRVRYDKKGIEQLEFPVHGTKEKPLSRLHPYQVFLIWSKKGLSFAIGNPGLDNLHTVSLEIGKLRAPIRIEPEIEQKIARASIENIDSFPKELEDLQEMWNSFYIDLIATRKSDSSPWLCFGLVFKLSNQIFPYKTEIRYNLNDRLIIAHHCEKFSFDRFMIVLSEIIQGTLTLDSLQVKMKNFDLRHFILERRPGWSREGLRDEEGWPAHIFRSYLSDWELINSLQEFNELLIMHEEPYSSISELTRKYLHGIEIGGSKTGAIYGVIPSYFKLENLKLDETGTIDVDVESHMCINPSNLMISVIIKDEADNVLHSYIVPLDRMQCRRSKENFWIINKHITNNLKGVSKANLSLVYKKSTVIYKDWIQLIKRARVQMDDAAKEIEISPPISPINSDPSVVFVIHGRNLKARDAMFEFLRSIGLRPIEMDQAISETRKGSPYIGEILDNVFAIAQAIVVLMTPDDEARLVTKYRLEMDPEYESELTPQPRQNVLFEAGMAIGIDQDRTIFVELGSLRHFSDISGRHTVRINNTAEKRRDLALRLETAGCEVDITGTNWITTGDFDSSLT